MVSFQFFSLSTYITLSLLISAGGAAPLDYADSDGFRLERRDKDNGPVKCFFEWNKAVQLKDNGGVFRNKCAKRTDKMSIPVTIGNPDVSTVFAGTFNECKAFDKSVGNCQCDHLLEPQEVLGVFSDVITVADEKKAPGNPLSSTQITALCKVLGDTTSGAQIRAIINDPDNLAGLYGNNQPGGNFVTAPNQEKNILLSASAADVKTQYSKLKWAYEIAALHMTKFKPNRGRAAEKVDNLLLEWDGLVAASTDQDAKAGWQLVVDSIGIGKGKTPIKTLADDNTDNVVSLVHDARPGGIAPVIKSDPVPKTPRATSGTPVPAKAPKRKATSSASNAPNKKPKLTTSPASGSNPAVPGPAQPIAPKRKASTSSTGSTSTANKKPKVATPSTTTVGSSTAKKVPAVPPKVPAIKTLPIRKPPPKTPVKPAAKPVAQKKPVAPARKPAVKAKL